MDKTLPLQLMQKGNTCQHDFMKGRLHQTNLMSSCDMGIHSVNEITAEDAVYLDALSLLSQVTSNWMRGNGLNGTREGLDWILGKSSPLEGLLTRAGVE